MGRLTRAEMQERNRAKVLAAARDEFIERGFRDAKIDNIAERAELTRGAVYSNFPGKQSLYFAVLAEEAENPPEPPYRAQGDSPRTALAEFARAWLARLPLATDSSGAARLGMDLIPEVLAAERTRLPYTQLMHLDAILLGLALERLHRAGTPTGRRVRVAETVLTTLHGARQLAAAAPGFVEPFNLVRAVEQVAELDLEDRWEVPHLAHIPQARPADEPWSPPPSTDALRDEPVRLNGDGVVAILGLHRISAIEEAVRAAPPDVDVTAVLVSGAPDELMPLARLTVAELRACLRQAVPESAWPRLRIVHDRQGLVASAAGVPAVSDATSTAVAIRKGRVVARADGWGACHAAALPLSPR
ncbi:TetR family transcriptional regulator [Micromonospora pisi]|uniref:TetR family transcriptional regulator n=1 Tax=Micromonospora pisi TaxID=589240 RepID=A0A495JT04_9ACTN|nr:TetR/AcrR family transcriptional regulator [Micromonospora pisi]RKR92127.1 TetR family transcriptional regulator [Micromonospora pisi]